MESYEYKVVDTNILLLDARNVLLLGADGAIVVIPETVVDEIDDKKSTPGELGYQAREFGRLIARSKKEGIIYPYPDLVASKRTIEGVEIHLVAKTTEYPSRKELPLSVYNDRRIIHIADYYPNSVFISNDVMCRVRAETEGLTVSDFKTIDSVDFEYIKHITIPETQFAQLHKKPITEVDETYKPENYNYVLHSGTYGQIKLGTVNNGLLEILGKETEKELRRQDVSPINAEQLFLSKAIQDPGTDIIVCEALSGSGKTAVAVSNGIRLVKQGAYEGILYIRASVDDVDEIEAVGFLPGMEEKFAVYLHPLHDTLDFIVRNRLKGAKEKGEILEERIEGEIEALRTKCNIQAITGLGMRGRTFNNMYVIIDEVQNQSKASLQKVLTRMGKGCKIVVIGSLRQIDNKYLTKFTSGLSTLLDAATRTHENIRMHAVTLRKVVRSPLAEFAENLFSKK